MYTRKYTLVQRSIGLSKMIIWVSLAVAAVAGACWSVRRAF